MVKGQEGNKDSRLDYSLTWTTQPVSPSCSGRCRALSSRFSAVNCHHSPPSAPLAAFPKVEMLCLGVMKPRCLGHTCLLMFAATAVAPTVRMHPVAASPSDPITIDAAASWLQASTHPDYWPAGPTIPLGWSSSPTSMDAHKSHWHTSWVTQMQVLQGSQVQCLSPNRSSTPPPTAAAAALPGETPANPSILSPTCYGLIEFNIWQLELDFSCQTYDLCSPWIMFALCTTVVNKGFDILE